jgi:hypothetical protein
MTKLKLIPEVMTSREPNVYVLEFSNGTIKVGRGQAKSRIQTHKAAAAAFGVTLTDEYSCYAPNPKRVERQLIQWLEYQNYSKTSKEWFHGANFQATVWRLEGLADPDSEVEATNTRSDARCEAVWAAIEDRFFRSEPLEGLNTASHSTTFEPTGRPEADAALQAAQRWYYAGPIHQASLDAMRADLLDLQQRMATGAPEIRPYTEGVEPGEYVEVKLGERWAVFSVAVVEEALAVGHE